MDLFLFLPKKGEGMDEERLIAIRVIRAYLQELKRSYGSCFRTPAHAYQIIYQEIAATKLLNQIKTNKSLSPLTIIENFERMMDRYTIMNEFNSMQFSIQSDTADYILDEIIVYKERRRNQNGQIKIRKIH